jgi:protein-S-isoprenylcysteine O-methyltransferase Ste14
MFMKVVSDSPGVKFPPPFVYAAAVVGGLLLNRRWPIAIGGGILRDVIGWVLAGVWLALTFGSIGLFWRRHTSIIPNRPASTLVAAGPYRFTRNPMYVGLALLTAALGILLDTWWPILLLVPALVFIRVAVIAREEEYLRRRFGAEYEAYMRQVRRWL